MNATTSNEAPETPDVREAAKKYRSAGIAVVRLTPEEKTPIDVGWTARSAEPEEFEPDNAIGLMCGSISDGGVPGQSLVCIDIDDKDALALADEYVPPTGAVEGHPGKPRDHRYYFVVNVPAWAKSTAAGAVAAAAAAGRDPGPFTKHFRHKETRKGLFDFIGTGGQVAAPPTRRKDGTYRKWAPDCDISKAAVIEFDVLWAAVIRYAEALGAKIPDVGPDAPGAGGGEEAAGSAESAARPESRPARAPKAHGRVDDMPMEERARRARKYLQSVDLPRSGHGGQDATWRAICLVVNDFAVDDPVRALAVIREFNAWTGAAGEEQWDEAQLARKIGEAIAAGPKEGWPRGCKLFEAEDGQPRAWDDPARLADGFLAETTVRFVKDTAFEYSGGAYQVVSSEWLSARVREYAEWAADRECRRRRAEQDRQRVALRATLNAPAPGPDALPGSNAVHKQAQVEAQKELEKLNKAPRPVPQKVTQAMVANTTEAIRVRAQLPDRTELDSWLGGRSGPGVLAVENGLLDPVARTLESHTPEWFSTARLPVKYDPAAPTPEKWLAVLGELMQGDAERIAVLQEVFGACLDRWLALKFFAAFVGSGDNGKSVVLAVVRFLLGARNCSSINLDELSANRFAAFGLFGKLANVVGDQGHFESGDEGRLKTLTGGDLFTFEQKGKDTFSAVNGAKLVFACNTMPTFGDKSEAVWNRLIAVPFEFTVPAGHKNPDLLTEAHWRDELPGILVWGLDGLARLRARGGFTRSAKCEALKGQTRLDSNPARLFLQEQCEYTGNKEDKVTVDELYRAYKSWCESGGLKHPLTKQKFAKEARSAFPGLPESKPDRLKGHEGTHRCWVGLKRTAVTEVTEAPVAA